MTEIISSCSNSPCSTSLSKSQLYHYNINMYDILSLKVMNIYCFANNNCDRLYTSTKAPLSLKKFLVKCNLFLNTLILEFKSMNYSKCTEEGIVAIILYLFICIHYYILIVRYS